MIVFDVFSNTCRISTRRYTTQVRIAARKSCLRDILLCINRVPNENTILQIYRQGTSQMLAIEAIKRVQNHWKYVCICVYSIK